MTTPDDDILEEAWAGVRTATTDLHIALIKLRNSIPAGTFKKSLVRVIDRIRADINALEEGSRGK